MATTTPTRRIVDIDGAAEHLTVTVRFLRTLVAERRIPHLKVGKFLRFDLDDLDTWLDTCRVETVD
jgi:excisionase family DNA binding protein